MKGWADIMQALAASDHPEDRQLAEQVTKFVLDAPFLPEKLRQQHRNRSRIPATTPTRTMERRPVEPQREFQPVRDRRGPKIER